MYEFNFQKSSSVEEAKQLHTNASDGVYIAGGMTLVPTLKMRLASPTDVIDLGGIASLKGIETSSSSVTIGAMTTHSEVANSSAIPALAHLASGIGDAQVRNRGTIGGSLANSDPAADYPAAVVGLNATIHTSNRDIAADDFFIDVFETALDEDEIIVSVEFPIPSRAAYAKFPNPASRYAVVGVLIAETGGEIRVGVTGAGPCAFRAKEFEAALNQNLSADAIDGLTVSGVEFNSDLHASSEYRAHLLGVLTKRSVKKLVS